MSRLIPQLQAPILPQSAGLRQLPLLTSPIRKLVSPAPLSGCNRLGLNVHIAQPWGAVRFQYVSRLLPKPEKTIITGTGRVAFAGIRKTAPMMGVSRTAGYREISIAP